MGRLHIRLSDDQFRAFMDVLDLHKAKEDILEIAETLEQEHLRHNELLQQVQAFEVGCQPRSKKAARRQSIEAAARAQEAEEALRQAHEAREALHAKREQ